MSGVHKHPTISFRVSDREREMIEAKILASGMQKKDYFVRSCMDWQFMLFLLCRKCHPFSSLSPYVLADTVKPRLELAGADCEKILVIDESDKSLFMADERLEVS